MYGNQDRSLPQKIVITILELLLLGLAGWVLFGGAGRELEARFGWTHAADALARRYVIMSFSLIIFVRMVFTMFYLMRRRLPWREAMTVPFAFALYYVGFAILVLPSDEPLTALDGIAIALFLAGCLLNTGSELQRHHFKSRPENQGRLYTAGMFAWSRHINFFGDIVWVTAYALVSRNLWSALIVVFVFCFFAFFNVPKLDAYLAHKYGKAYERYAAHTKRLIPLIW